MAAKPTNFPEWGTSSLTETFNIEGISTTYSNKLEPTSGWKLSGAKYNENTPRQYINYQFDNIDSWIKHLDGKHAVGDIHMTTSAETATAISIRLGGTWVAAGTDTIGTASVNVFEKTV